MRHWVVNDLVYRLGGERGMGGRHWGDTICGTCRRLIVQ